MKETLTLLAFFSIEILETQIENFISNILFELVRGWSGVFSMTYSHNCEHHCRKEHFSFLFFMYKKDKITFFSLIESSYCLIVRVDRQNGKFYKRKLKFGEPSLL